MSTETFKLSSEQRKVAEDQFKLKPNEINFVENFRETFHKLDPKIPFWFRASQAVKIVLGSQYNYNSLPPHIKKFISHLGGKASVAKASSYKVTFS